MLSRIPVSMCYFFSGIFLMIALIHSIRSFIKRRKRIAVIRLHANPVITPGMIEGEGGMNINGPSLIRVPDWLASPLGKYYLYFAHHKGRYIRLAYADELTGPWKVYEKGTLSVEDCPFLVMDGDVLRDKHVASPDVHVDAKNQRIVMYFHCPVARSVSGDDKGYPQASFVASSMNGIDFIPREEILGNAYFRVFKWNDYHYALSKPGTFFKSKDGLASFEQGPNPFAKIRMPGKMRHGAVLMKDNKLYVFFSRIGDNPERILVSRISLSDDWNDWKPTPPITLLKPELPYEGIDLKNEKSRVGASWKRSRQLRDPAIFEEEGEIYLLYTVAGESGIAIAEIHLNDV